MKKIIVLLFIFMITSTSIMGDEIYLSDGTVIKGKIIQVTPERIEYDPAGSSVFDIVPRGRILKIVYEDGSVVTLGEKSSDRETPSGPESALVMDYIEIGEAKKSIPMTVSISDFYGAMAAVNRSLKAITEILN